MSWKDPLLGRVLNDRYEVKERIGKGGYGVVYRVEHLALGKMLALKALFRSSQLNPRLVGRFEREAKATSRIGHPNIVDVVDYGQDDVCGYYFIMEYLEGRTLQRELKESGALKPIRAVRIAKQIGSALLATHQNGIIHRDLKPENVMLMSHVGTHHDFVKVLDYGVAGLSIGEEDEEEDEPRLTAAGAVFGTPHYMSPEQALSPDVGHPSDIYSFGVMLYEMVCGRLPFDAPNTIELLELHRTKAPERPSVVRPDALIPAELEQVIMKCLAKEPARRWASSAEILERLDAVEASILRGVPVVLARDAAPDASLFAPPRPTESQLALLPPLQPPPPRYLLWGGVSALIGALVVAVLMLPQWRSRAQSPPAPTPPAASEAAALAPSQTEPERRAAPTPKPEAVPAKSVATPPRAETASPVVARPPVLATRMVRRKPATGPTGWTVTVSSVPPGAEVSDKVTKAPLGKTPVTLTLLPGASPRLLVVKAKGRLPKTLTLDGDALREAGETTAEVKLKKRGTTRKKDEFDKY